MIGAGFRRVGPRVSAEERKNLVSVIGVELLCAVPPHVLQDSPLVTAQGHERMMCGAVWFVKRGAYRSPPGCMAEKVLK